jgi:hypothetical protein
MIKTYESYTGSGDIYRELFTIESFKKEYSNFINGLMPKLYTGDNWKKLAFDCNHGIVNTNYPMNKAFEYLERSRPGNKLVAEVKAFYAKVYQMKDPIWSLLNYVNTHFTVFRIIVDELNDYVAKGGFKDFKTKLDFTKNPFEELKTMKLMLETRASQKIFLPVKEIFYKIMGEIAMTTYIGDYAENKMLEHMTEFGNITDIIKSRPGQRIDTHRGIDIRFKLNGIPKTIQCKSYVRCVMEGQDYTFSNISNPGDYRVDYFAFVNRSLIFVFSANKGGVAYDRKGSTYKFDKSLYEFMVKL